jgi:HEAT repeat protein
MSTNDYSALSDERLLELFTDGARQLGFVTNRNERLRWLKGARETKPEVDDEACRPIIARTREIAEALRERKSIAAVKLLLEDDDPDVRAVASIALGDLAPDLSYAAVQAAYAGLATDHVADLQRRARQKPPERPTLAELSDDDLIARFKDAAERESGTHFLDYLDDPADKDLQNEIVVEVWDIMRQLKARGLLARLLPLLASDDLTVRREAATACLRVAAPQAEAALESVARDGTYPDSFLAREALANWRDKGQIVYGV